MGILIVDDEPDMCATLRMLLGLHGYENVYTAGNGREALQILAATGPPIDLILTDVNMPGLNGIEICRFVKDTPHLHDIPILVITGTTNEPVLARAFAAGAHDFLPKLISPIELVARVRAALELKRELDRRKARERELVEMTHKLKRLNGKLRRLSVLDELTGIPNRRYFNVLLQQEWERAARDQVPLSLVMIDIDSFKSFNDQYGHLAGDVCLAQVARTLSDLIRRPGDAVCRYGGEEFVILLANTNLPGARTVSETLRTAIEALNLEHARSPFGHVTISLGVACAHTQTAGSAEAILTTADQALYRAKANGRNCVEVTNFPINHVPLSSVIE